MIEPQFTEASKSKRPAGMVDHEVRTAIRDLIEEYGPDKAAEKVRYMVADETERRRS